MLIIFAVILILKQLESEPRVELGETNDTRQLKRDESEYRLPTLSYQDSYLSLFTTKSHEMWNMCARSTKLRVPKYRLRS